MNNESHASAILSAERCRDGVASGDDVARVKAIASLIAERDLDETGKTSYDSKLPVTALGVFVLRELQQIAPQIAGTRDSNVPNPGTHPDLSTNIVPIDTVDGPITIGELESFIDSVFSNVIARQSFRVDRKISIDDGDYHLYVLRLDHQCWYVGTTKRSVHARVSEHLAGESPLLGGLKGACWPRLHAPLPCYPLSDPLRDVTDDYFVWSKYLQYRDSMSAELIEDEVTQDFMLKFGWRRVRGGSFTRCGADETRSDMKGRLTNEKWKELVMQRDEACPAATVWPSSCFNCARESC